MTYFQTGKRPFPLSGLKWECLQLSGGWDETQRQWCTEERVAALREVVLTWVYLFLASEFMSMFFLFPVIPKHLSERWKTTLQLTLTCGPSDPA